MIFKELTHHPLEFPDPDAVQTAETLEITGLTADSRAVEPGFVFAALKGVKVDGADFIKTAVEAGAAVVLIEADRVTERVRADVGSAGLLIVEDARKELAVLAAAFSGAQPENVVAVTGTAGKTSVAVFVRQIFEYAGLVSASLGTIGTVTSTGKSYGGLTTPDPVSLHQDLKRLAEDGVTHAAMEASSHGLDQHRLDGVKLKAAGFTNLGRDHMDYHPTVEDYLQAKLRLFRDLLPDDGVVVIDPDTQFADRVMDVAHERGLRLFTVGFAGEDLKLLSVEPDGFRQMLQLETAEGTFAVPLPLAGDFQVSNALIAAGLAINAGVPLLTALEALTVLQGAPGRLEHVGTRDNSALVFVDYAHKPEALENVLQALRPFAPGRLISVFGCGGDRDKGKRPLMGEISARLADVSIVTDDNPRTEDPAPIRAEIVAACPGAIEIGDRAEAIRQAVGMLQPGDVLCVAGKGHEEGQIIGTDVLPFSDHEQVAKAIALADASSMSSTEVTAAPVSLDLDELDLLAPEVAEDQLPVSAEEEAAAETALSEDDLMAALDVEIEPVLSDEPETVAETKEDAPAEPLADNLPDALEAELLGDLSAIEAEAEASAGDVAEPLEVQLDLSEDALLDEIAPEDIVADPEEDARLAAEALSDAVILDELAEAEAASEGQEQKTSVELDGAENAPVENAAAEPDTKQLDEVVENLNSPEELKPKHTDETASEAVESVVSEPAIVQETAPVVKEPVAQPEPVIAEEVVPTPPTPAPEILIPEQSPVPVKEPASAEASWHAGPPIDLLDPAVQSEVEKQAVEPSEDEGGPLWRPQEFIAAVTGLVYGDVTQDITGISIDTRTLQPGDAFFAIQGENFDGHGFVEKALEAGASVAVVLREKLSELPKDGRYVAVEDVLKGLERLGVASRARSGARIIAVTGSVGKTGSKEALRLCLSRSGRTHAPVASFNNHWGVPLTLARMPRDTEYGIFEIGMNHSGEITPLVKMVRPHVAMITTVEAVHLEAFNSVEDIAKAKAEIFQGLEPGGTVILNRDNRQYDLLRYLAAVAGVRNVVSFGLKKGADSYSQKVAVNADCSCLNAVILGQEMSYKIGAPGAHHVINSLGVLTGVSLLGANLALAGLALAEMKAPKGRGEQSVLHLHAGTALLIDESYNANPASMKAALELLSGLPVKQSGRRIAVLGDMLELGVDSDKLHADLARVLARSKVDMIYCVGTHMKELWERLPAYSRGAYSKTSDKLEKRLLSDIRPNDIMMIKGSLGTKMGPMVTALKKRFPDPAESGES